MSVQLSKKNKVLSISVERRSGYDDDYFVGTVSEEGLTISQVESSFFWLALRRTKRALRLYKKHGITVRTSY